MPDRDLEQFLKDQEKLNSDLERAETAALDFKHAVEQRPTKKTVYILFAILAVLFTVSTLVDGISAYNSNKLANENNEILSTLDPESPDYEERRENLIEVIIAANNKSNFENYCEVERGIRIGFREPDDPVPPPSDRCAEYDAEHYGG